MTPQIALVLCYAMRPSTLLSDSTWVCLEEEIGFLFGSQAYLQCIAHSGDAA